MTPEAQAAMFVQSADTGVHITLWAGIISLIAKDIYVFFQSRRNGKDEKGEMRESLVGNKLDIIASKLDTQTTILNSQTALLNELVLESRVETEIRKRSGS